MAEINDPEKLYLPSDNIKLQYCYYHEIPEPIISDPETLIRGGFFISRSLWSLLITTSRTSTQSQINNLRGPLCIRLGMEEDRLSVDITRSMLVEFLSQVDGKENHNIVTPWATIQADIARELIIFSDVFIPYVDQQDDYVQARKVEL